ncbi:hypothetical protein [Aquimarina sp. 2304DJ70-9]|uniref:hypothetical protein n=1 Tax=Aquimarina penaris TaxID=3231044 RepID=UPI003462139A
MKKILISFLILASSFVVAQETIDIVTPQKSSFNSGQNIEGFVQSSINEPTGKVNFPVPITKITSRTVYYDLSLNYNGNLAFDEGSNTNKYNSTSEVGVGFGLNVPRVVVDNKNTTTREDDEFYLQSTDKSTKLHCIRRNELGVFETGNIIWEFQAENFVPWKIKYYKASKDFVNGLLTEIPLDFWIITNDEGADYLYGVNANARENLVGWGNWIGNSNQPGRSRETIVWNLSTIRDQWNNNIRFEYEKQESTVGGVSQTEAAYLKKIISSTGENVVLTYGDKDPSEFYEPHQEKIEPDAYQERYEKRFLQSIASYNSDNNLIYNYNFTYSLINNNSSTDKKRYLANIAQENANGEFLPSQKFEYYTSGTFKGGIKTITYPTGGSVTYKYKNKLLFNNTPNNYVGTSPTNVGFNFYAIATKENYTLTLLKSQNPVSNGKHQFKVIRQWWNGQGWEQSAFTLPYLIRDDYPNGNTWLQNFHAVFGKDFYGFLYMDGNGDNTKVDLFHLKSTGTSWVRSSYDSTDIFSLNTVEESDTAFISGDNFVALADGVSSALHTFTWNSNKNIWAHNVIDQRTPNDGSLSYFHYSAANNYILVLDRGGLGTGIPSLTREDYITGVRYKDRYYIHYLNLENRWESKSWSAIANPILSKIEKDSYFYPDNAMSGFVADHNSEFFIRWDKNYNVLTPDDVLGRHNDANPIVPTYSGMFILQSWLYQKPIKFARFNGVGWNVKDFLHPNGSYPSYGEDFMTYSISDNGSRYSGFAAYNANLDLWEVNNFFSSDGGGKSGATKDFLVLRNKIYKLSNTTIWPTLNSTLPTDNIFTHTNGNQHAFVELEGASESDISDNQGLLYYVDKTTDQMTNINLGNKSHYLFSGPSKFAGRTPIMSSKSLFIRSKTSNSPNLYRFIDDKVNNDVRDIVVNIVEINDGRGEIRATTYSYDTPNSTPNNDITYYGDVAINNIGYYGTPSPIGKIEKKYNNGVNDLQMAGLLTQEKILDQDGSTVSLKINNWRKFDEFSKSYTIKLERQYSRLYFEGGILLDEIETTYALKPYVLPVSVKHTNSMGEIEETITKYAYEEYPFMKDENFINQPYEIINKVDGKETLVNKTIWVKDSNNKIYASETWSGNSSSSLRKTHNVSKMNDYGQIIETSNGKGQYNSILFGSNYKYPIATLSNVRYDNVINNLDITMSSLQNLDDLSLKSELLKLYDKLPEAMIEVSIYDVQGKLITKIDQRQEEMNYKYDNFNRLIETSDLNNKLLEKIEYNYKQ